MLQVTIFETLVIMISFSTLIVAVIALAYKMSQKNNPPLSFAARVDYFIGQC